MKKPPVLLVYGFGFVLLLAIAGHGHLSDVIRGILEHVAEGLVELLYRADG